MNGGASHATQDALYEPSIETVSGFSVKGFPAPASLGNIEWHGKRKRRVGILNKRRSF